MAHLMFFVVVDSAYQGQCLSIDRSSDGLGCWESNYGAVLFTCEYLLN